MAAGQRGAFARGTVARRQARAAQERHAAGAGRRSELQASRIPGEGRLDGGPRTAQREAQLCRCGSRQVAAARTVACGNWRVRSESFRRIREAPMINRRILLKTAAAAMFVPVAALAAEERPFTQQAFGAAQSAGKSILVEIHASWCPTCRAQKPILSKLFVDPRYKN